MEIAHLCKITYNYQLQQSIYLYHKRNMSQIWQVNTLAEPKLRSHHADAYLQTLINVPNPVPSVNLLHIMESKKWLRQDFQTHCHCDKVKGQIYITP